MKTGIAKYQPDPFLVVETADEDPFGRWSYLSSRPALQRSSSLQQAWLKQSDPDFSPGWITAVRRKDVLFMMAHLEGDQIGNPVMGHNQLAFCAGDVFEIFLQPFGCEEYVEIHVTPNNDRLELRFPSSTDRSSRSSIADLKEQLEPFFVHDSSIRSLVRLPDPSRWEVMVAVPFDLFRDLPQTSVTPDHWRFSCCRYDYRCHRTQPILSSTSHHQVCDFHRIEEWGKLHVLD